MSSSSDATPVHDPSDRHLSTLPAGLLDDPLQWNAADRWIAIAATILAALAFLNSLGGGFVYDDIRQIVGNDLIRDNRLILKALTSDVWAFKGDGETAISNYWRPGFVLWLILNHRLFGLESPAGWHATSILLHVGVVYLALRVMRTLGVPRGVAAASAIIFAVHPVHVESVAWISGSTDPLAALLMLATLLLYLRRDAKPTAAVLGVYALALLTKELSILFPAIVVVVLLLRNNDAESGGSSWKAAFWKAAPFALMGAAYLAARYAVLGHFQGQGAWSPGVLVTLATTPSMLAFYLRQIAAPIWLGPNYPIRAVGADNLSMWNFVLPAAVVLLVALAVAGLARRWRPAWFGLAVALLILPAMNIAAFVPEELVHDRYLYLPLLGFCILLFGALARLIEAAGASPRAAQRACIVAAAIATPPLLWQTIDYNAAWRTNLGLWERGVKIDPGSASSWQQYGVYLNEAGRTDEAREALDRALAIEPLTNAYLARADVAAAQGRWNDSIADARLVIEKIPGEYMAHERLAVALAGAGRLDDAAAALRAARDAIPGRAAAFTDKLAIVLYRLGRRTDALVELEAVQDSAAREFGPGARLAIFRLAMLYDELGRRDDARRTFLRFLACSQGITHPEIAACRRDAAEWLARPGN